jgi:hypothetical protein
MLGRIKEDVHNLTLRCSSGSRDFHPFRAVAEAVNKAHSLCRLDIGLGGETFPKDSSGLSALAIGLQDHAALDDFTTWGDLCPRLEAAQEDTPDFVLGHCQRVPTTGRLPSRLNMPVLTP